MIKQQLRIEIQVSLRWLMLRMVYDAFDYSNFCRFVCVIHTAEGDTDGTLSYF